MYYQADRRPSVALIEHLLGRGTWGRLAEVEPVNLQDALSEPLRDRLARASHALESLLRVVSFEIDDRHRSLRRLLMPDGLVRDALTSAPLHVVTSAWPDRLLHDVLVELLFAGKDGSYERNCCHEDDLQT
jgi:hypothetical protein